MKQSLRLKFVSLAVLCMVAVMVVAAGASTETSRLSASLSGAEEVPPVATDAWGKAKFTITGTMVDFLLIVHDIDNVVQAHIHCGAFGSNGPVVQFLYGPAAPGGGPEEGLIARGTFDASGKVCGAMTLIDAMEAELTYANVHTDDGNPGTSGGAGDTPSGEIRGQIVPRG